MFKFLNNHIALSWILLLSLLGIYFYALCSHGEAVTITNSSFFTNKSFHLLNTSKFALISITAITLIAQLFLIQAYSVKNTFIPKRSLFPAIFYMILLFVTDSHCYITPIFFINFILLIILYLDISLDTSPEKSHRFLSGLLIGLATCIDFSAIILIPYSILVLLINLYSKRKEISLMLTGFIMFFVYLGLYYFFTDNLPWFISSIKDINALQLFEYKSLNIIQWISLAASFLLLIYALIKIKIQYENKIIVMRKRLSTFIILFVIVFFTLLFTNFSYPEILKYFIVPIAIILGLNSEIKSKMLSQEILSLLIILGLCF